MSEVRDPEVFRAVLDALPIAVYIVDRNGTILFWNKSAERITGHQRHEVIGHSRRENVLVQCDQHSCPMCGESCPFHQTEATGEHEKRLLLRHKSGHPVPVLFRVTSVPDRGGAIQHVAVSFQEPRAAMGVVRNRRAPVPSICLDETTGVANHGFVEFHLRENLAGFIEYHVPFGIMCLQVDHFDHLRAAYGSAARRLMQQSGLGENQVSQIRGFADQMLRQLDAPLDASNRRISVIVQNMEASPEAAAKAAEPAYQGARPSDSPPHGEVLKHE